MSNLICTRDEEAFTRESSPLLPPHEGPKDRYDNNTTLVCVCVYLMCVECTRSSGNVWKMYSLFAFTLTSKLSCSELYVI